jgi:hypothetical protein
VNAPFDFGGAPLMGCAPVRFLYVDEAGTSAREPMTVVAGVLLHADRHWLPARSYVSSLLDSYVPSHLRNGFVFHAKKVWNGGRDIPGWEITSRLRLIKAMAKVPRVLGMHLCVGKVRRDTAVPDFVGKIRKEQFQHAEAFVRCVAQADICMERFAEPQEVAIVVAEDVPEMRRLLRSVVDVTRVHGLPVAPGGISLASTEGVQASLHDALDIRLHRVVDSVHFEPKTGAVLLQIADACAFSFRRCFAGEKYGDELVRSMLPMGVRLLPKDAWQQEAISFAHFHFTGSPTAPGPFSWSASAQDSIV